MNPLSIRPNQFDVANVANVATSQRSNDKKNKHILKIMLLETEEVLKQSKLNKVAWRLPEA